ncbi:HEAT repeat domain-containing protein [Haloarculaceae archaeon H-GB2-1]|nr:HEAT repeat domain-containing protein [Haloarculaceae archaeon H-GB1-1]MEA5386891.1 HEAT repeat domain-containing protein [Haloarculaceae archaeon H-GB11]MEA5408370.1 HEAT repeat domain-containing protein [Haloarculaceae archaeon H-GB2-1]
MDDEQKRAIEEAIQEDPDPQLDPAASPGFGEEFDGLETIDVGRDVTLGEATHEEMMAADTTPVVGDATESVVEDLLAGDVPERRRAALALSERPNPDEDVLHALSSAALQDCDADVRQFAVESLGKLGGELARETALEVTDDPDPWARSEAYVTLDRLDREAFAEELTAALDDDHHAVRRNAAISMFKLHGEDAEDQLLDMVDDPSGRVREWVAHLLSGIENDRVSETLHELAREDEVEVVRRTAQRALEADAGRFRRQFRGVLEGGRQQASMDDSLNRRPDL